MKNVALLVFACDRYELLFKGFEYFFNKNWDSTLLVKKYFATESKSIELDGFTHIKSGTGEWTNRLKHILDQIEEEYIIFFQEDMWMSKKVKKGLLEKVIEYIQKNDLKLVKLHSSDVYQTEETGVDFDGLLLTKVNKKKSDYLMSHQVSVWHKNFFYAQLQNNEHPWRNERKGNKRLKKDTETIYQVDFLSENGKAPINNNLKENLQGEYHTISVNACIHHNAKPFVKELEPDFPEYAKKLFYHIENEITHDGKAVPRNEDFVKKLKNRLRFGKVSHTKRSFFKE